MDTDIDMDVEMEDVFASANALVDFLESVESQAELRAGEDTDNHQNSSACAWYPCMLIPEIARKVFSHFLPSDLANVRLVCKSWSDVSSCVAGEAMEADFSTSEALRTFNASEGSFARSINKFRMNMSDRGNFNDADDLPGILPHYNEFFENFGGQVKSLSFAKYAPSLMKLAFATEIRLYLTKLETLKIWSDVNAADVPTMNFEHLRSLRHLRIDTGDSGYGGPEILKKILDQCQIKSLKIIGHPCIREVLNEALRKVLSHPHLETLSLQVLCAHCRNTFDRIAENVEPPPLKHLSINNIGPRATPQLFYKFFVHFQDSLQSLTLTGFYAKYLEALPNFTSLKSLILRFCDDDDDGLDFDDPLGVLDLAFFTKYSRLEKLGLANFRAFNVTSLATCRNENLRTLNLELNDADSNAIQPVLEAKCFPNLSKLILLIANDSLEWDWKLGDSFRMEFSLRSSEFRHFMTHMPNTKLIQGQADSILGATQIEVIRRIHGYIIEHCSQFREAQLQSARANLQIICLLSSTTAMYWSGKTHYVTMTHSQLRSAGDKNLKRNRIHSYQIQELDVLGHIPTFLLEQLSVPARTR